MTQATLLLQIKSLQEALQRLENLPMPPESRQAVEEAVQIAGNLSQTCEEDIKALEAQVQAANQSKSQFVSHVTHELRLPLTSIRGYTDLLRQGLVGQVNEQQINFLNVVKSNVERMTTLISDLADVNYLDTGRMKFSPSLVYLDHPVEEIVEKYKTRIAEKEQTLTVEIPEEISPVYADAIRLSQVIITLINNAWRYTPKGGKIAIRAINHEGQVKLEIQDTGIGISPADQEKIFSPFFRSEDEAVRESPGWGLALHLAWRLIQAMGGEMGFESTLRQGSSFWFLLPTQETR